MPSRLKIGLIGYGAMGQLIAHRSETAGHSVVEKFSRKGRPAADELPRRLAATDVVIDFSSAASVVENVHAAAAAGRPIVIGTTGWGDKIDEVRNIAAGAGIGVLFGANFSIGVNIFYRVVRTAAELFAAASGYESFLEEQHHARKKDAPSGTALKIQSILQAAGAPPTTVTSTRAGHIPGTHRVGFDGGVDQILLTHTARSREGFADGAIAAAEWIIGRCGVYEFDDLMRDILKED